VTETFLLF